MPTYPPARRARPALTEQAGGHRLARASPAETSSFMRMFALKAHLPPAEAVWHLPRPSAAAAPPRANAEPPSAVGAGEGAAAPRLVDHLEALGRGGPAPYCVQARKVEPVELLERRQLCGQAGGSTRAPYARTWALYGSYKTGARGAGRGGAPASWLNLVP
jgi:hypothetical protein